jgi:cysteinyl-tRNA synthetase
MKNSIYFIIIILIISILTISCNSDDDGSANTIYKQYMRSFVQNISAWAKAQPQQADFIIIPQNGHELATVNGNEEDPPDTAYIDAIDGAGQEDLFYGYDYDDITTPAVERDYLLSFLDLYESNGVEVLVTDYCSTSGKMDDSYAQSFSRGFISFAADHRDLDIIPVYPAIPYKVNDLDITSLTDAKNFLYLLDPSVNYATKNDFITAIDATNYDIFIIDLFYYDDLGNETQLDAEDIAGLQTKPDAGENDRLVICYMSIGEAEDYRYYWEGGWEPGSPDWIVEENPDWEGNYKVQYWDPEWQAIIYGDVDSYLQKIIDSGFDGVYLDIIDAFEYFE